MKPLFCLKTTAFAVALAFSFSSCERVKKTETTTTATDRDTVTVSRTESRTNTDADNEAREFKNWVNKETSRADSNAKEKWPEIKEGFRTRTAQLEKNLDSLSTDARREYEEAKTKYQAWENRRDTRTAQPLNETKLNTWRRELLGERRAYSTVTGTNAKETYLLFMGVVRAKHDNWTNDDWDYVDQVYGELNDRKREIESNISAADRVKIKALQTEYLAFEAAADARDATKDNKNVK